MNSLEQEEELQVEFMLKKNPLSRIPHSRTSSVWHHLNTLLATAAQGLNS